MPTGVVAGVGATFNVTGNHTFLEEGAYTGVVVGVTIVDTDGGPINAPGRSSATVVSTGLVADAPLTPLSQTFTATEGALFNPLLTIPVAKFTDTDPGGVITDYGTPTINWGDGSITAGSLVHLSGDPATTFTVLGSHTYLEEGTYSVAVAVGDFGGANTIVSSTATVADAALLAPSAIQPPTNLGVEGSAVPMGWWRTSSTPTRTGMWATTTWRRSRSPGATGRRRGPIGIARPEHDDERSGVQPVRLAHTPRKGRIR